METIYTQEGQTFWPSRDAADSIHKVLPAGTYIIGTHPMRGWFFQRVEPPTLPAKVYGDVKQRTQRVLTTFAERPNATGVLLAGIKGSGKTMQAAAICNTAAQMGYPTILINMPYRGDEFMRLLQDIRQPCVVFFDEFEKVYSEQEHQQAVLTMFDGVFQSKKLFLLTVNDRFAVNEHMRDRPGRLFYSFEYGSISKAFILEYCADNLKDKSQADGVAQAATLFYQFNFDMLKAMVEEMNRYNESAADVIKVLNMRPANNYDTKYMVTMTHEGLPIDGIVMPTVFNGHPLRAEVLTFIVAEGGGVKDRMSEATAARLSALAQNGCLGDDQDDFLDAQACAAGVAASAKEVVRKPVQFFPEDLHRIDHAADSYTFRNKDGYVVTLTLRGETQNGFQRHYGMDV